MTDEIDHSESKRTEAPPKPERPRAIDLASAILIATGALGVFAALAFARGLPPGAAPVFISTIVIGVSSIVLGWLIRRGQAWAVAMTFAAVLGFLDLARGGSSPLSLVLGLGDILVVGLLVSNRAWFDAMRDWRAASRQDSRSRTSP